MVMMFGWGGLFLWTIIEPLTLRARFDRELAATIARRLHPLSPTQQELEATRIHLQKEGHEEIAKLKSQEIMEAMSEGQAAGTRVKES